MKHTFLARARVPALALVVAVSLAACTGGSDDGTGHDMAGMSGASPSTEDPTGSASEAGAADVMFAQMMVPHHEQAIEMADALLAKDGTSPELVDLAERIKAAQGPEIETLTGWLEAWGAEPAADGHAGTGDGTGDGMMTADDMQALDDAQGADAERLFLEQMVVHHEGAVEMAQAEVSDGEDADAVAMAQAIVDTQTDEIQQMKELLASR